MVTLGETYVERVERALVETTVLAELEQHNDLSLDELLVRVKRIGGFGACVDGRFVESCIRRLTRDGRLRAEGGRYLITPDGREDVHRIETLLCAVAAAEVPGVQVPPDRLGP